MFAPVNSNWMQRVLRRLKRKSCEMQGHTRLHYISAYTCIPLNHLTQAWVGSTAMLALCPAYAIYPNPNHHTRLQLIQLYCFWSQASSKTTLWHVDIHRAVEEVQFEWINCAIFQLNDLMDSALQICSHGNVETAMEIQAVSSQTRRTRRRTKTFSPFEWTKAGAFSSANM